MIFLRPSEYPRPLPWLHIAVIGLFCLNAHFSHALTDQEEKFHFRFAHNKTNYSVYASFPSPLATGDILDILFDYHHVKEFTKSVDSVKMIDEGERWNRLTFRRCEVFGCVEATYLREVDKNSRRLRFVLEESHTGGDSFIPRVINNSGYYQVKPFNNGSLVEFFQEVDLEDSIFLIVYERWAESSTREFVRDLCEYLQKSPGQPP